MVMKKNLIKKHRNNYLPEAYLCGSSDSLLASFLMQPKLWHVRTTLTAAIITSLSLMSATGLDAESPEIDNEITHEFIAEPPTLHESYDQVSVDTLKALSQQLESDVYHIQQELAKTKLELSEAYAFAEDLQLTIDDLYGALSDQQTERLAIEQQNANALHHMTTAIDHAEEIGNKHTELQAALAEKHESLTKLTALAQELSENNLRLQQEMNITPTSI